MALSDFIDRLVTYEPGAVPVLSLYLNLQPDQHGRDNYETFLRREFKSRLETFKDDSAARQSLQRDIERVNRYLAHELDPAKNGAAIFACAGNGDFFEAIQLTAPVDDHRLYLAPAPHVYPLARLDDQYPRYAALLLDTHRARLFVFATNRVVGEVDVVGQKTRRTDVGGWSQARYQRHVENFHLQHVKEVVDVLEKVVRTEDIPRVIVAGDEVVVPLLREQLPQILKERLVDVIRLDMETPDHEVLTATLAALREHDAETDEEKVRRLFDEYRSGGLGVIRPKPTLDALTLGQVDELLISATLDTPTGDGPPGAGNRADRGRAGEGPDIPEQVVEELIARARQTAAHVTFIENADLLREADGVGGLLRFRL